MQETSGEAVRILRVTAMEILRAGEDTKDRAGEGVRAAGAIDQAALVAVIEDEAIVMIGYQMLFESWGYRVVAAGSADE